MRLLRFLRRLDSKAGGKQTSYRFTVMSRMITVTESLASQPRRSKTLEQKTADAIALGREILNPSLRNSDYLVLEQRRRILANWLKRVPGNDLKVLDVGGRLQPYRPLLNGRLKFYVAVDPDPTGLVDAIAVGEHLPFPSSTFDLVLCTQVLCYVEDPPQVIDEIRRVLRPGGTLLLTAPALLLNHAANDRWRFLPNQLYSLLREFTTVEVSAEGGSISGICRTVAMFVDYFFEHGPAHPFLIRAVVPFLNLLGERLDCWSRGDIGFTTNYDAFAIK